MYMLLNCSQKLKRHLYILFLSFSLLFSNGCDLYYKAVTPNIPVFDENEIIKAEIVASNNGIDGKANLRVLQYGVIQFQANFADRSIFLRGKNSYYCLGGGGLYQSSKSHISFVGGYGRGWLEFSEGIMAHNYRGTGEYDQIYVQPAFAYNFGKLMLGISSKTALMNYRIVDISNPEFTPENTGVELNKNYKTCSIEPCLFIKADIYREVDLSLYISKNLFFSEIPYYRDLRKSELCLGVGLTIKFFKKAKNH